MAYKEIIIREATSADIQQIWRLLHSEGKRVDFEEIANRPERFCVLARGTELLGVYDSAGDGRQVERVTVHPLQPQNLLEEIMVGAVNGIMRQNLS